MEGREVLTLGPFHRVSDTSKGCTDRQDTKWLEGAVGPCSQMGMVVTSDLSVGI